MRLILIFLFAISTFITSAQTEIPKREFRAAWVATVSNIDWPSKKGLDVETQKQEFVAILDRLKENGMNAVIVQIRPAADAFYNSPYENWSRYLTGTQGVAPNPFYDPLTFMIEEAHKRCIEFHAWFNPYRALVDASKNPNTNEHVTFQHPEWFLNYGGKKYFDPGLPEVRQYFTKVVLDVVKRYDIDAVHFDDYFYPYRIPKVEFPDNNSYAKYGTNFTNKDDWRRHNVDILIESLSQKIKKEKSYVKFGISPFGVWRNFSKDPEGSLTKGGQTNYDDLYADVILWQKKGWIDYLLPQLYWENGHRAADYNELINWWSKHAYGRNMYVGHGIYQVGTSTKPCWQSLHEVEHQIDQTRNVENINGSAFYSAVSFKKNYFNLNNTMKNKWYPTPALLPSMPWIDDEEPIAPILKISNVRDGNKTLQWSISNPQNESLQFAVYRFALNEKIYIHSSKNLIAIVRGNSFVDQLNDGKQYKYVVTALDRLHNESQLSNSVQQ